MGCFTTIVFVAGFIFMMVTLLRWFEQITEAVDLGLWNKVLALIAVPFLVWVYPSRVAAGRPTPFPLHVPVRGFGAVPRAKAPEPRGENPEDPPLAAIAPPPTPPASDQPPPGTPAEFLGLPKVPPPKPKGSKAGLDPEKIAKLRQKMREQGMLPPEE
jgi:hypothetical protein